MGGKISANNPFANITNTIGSAANAGINAFQGGKQEANNVKGNAAQQSQATNMSGGGDAASAQLAAMESMDKKQAQMIALQNKAAEQNLMQNTLASIAGAQADTANKSISNVAQTMKGISY
ncbi:hypothetical protein [Pseudomonas fluorescens]|jgi:sugar/nucleoside kinase (ribokinase family)|uniref:hypothetical protein n=1 Tax=Pseudomonas fluorescens TaxID=294 RepID=UPI0027841A82|nr:hypothetical protein [Pseudomonas fluorescens]MDP9782276.1 sugar/nucleoside kinase (ribokinase family) [Pseudomonas fluorescens]